MFSAAAFLTFSQVERLWLSFNAALEKALTIPTGDNCDQRTYCKPENFFSHSPRLLSQLGEENQREKSAFGPPVLLQAAKDVSGFTSVDDERHPLALQRRACAWFASNYDGMGSYLWVCDLIDLEPSLIRRRMIRVLNTGEVGKQGEGAFSTAGGFAAVLEGADEYELELASDLLSA